MRGLIPGQSGYLHCLASTWSATPHLSPWILRYDLLISCVPVPQDVEHFPYSHADHSQSSVHIKQWIRAVRFFQIKWGFEKYNMLTSYLCVGRLSLYMVLLPLLHPYRISLQLHYDDIFFSPEYLYHRMMSIFQSPMQTIHNHLCRLNKGMRNH